MKKWLLGILMLLSIHAFASPPSIPTGLAVVTNTAGSVTLTWNAVSGVGIKYNVYENGTLLGENGNTTATVSGLAAGVLYGFGVQAKNINDETSGISPYVTATAGAPSGQPTNVYCVNCASSSGGDASAANQVIGNASLSSIDSKLTTANLNSANIYGQLTTTSNTRSQPVRLTYTPDVNILNSFLNVSITSELGQTYGSFTLSGNLSPSASVVIVALPGFSQATNALRVGLTNSATAPANMTLAYGSKVDTYTATGTGSVLTLTAKPLKSFALVVKGTGAAPTSFTTVLEGSLDGLNWTTILTSTNVTPGDGSIVWQVAGVITPVSYIRTNVTALVLGSATDIVVRALGLQ